MTELDPISLWMQMANYSFSRNNRSHDMDIHSVSANASLTLRPWKSISISGEGYWGMWKTADGMRKNPVLASITAEKRFAKFVLFAKCNNIAGTKEVNRVTATPYQKFTATSYLRGSEYMIGLRMSL